MSRHGADTARPGPESPDTGGLTLADLTGPIDTLPEAPPSRRSRRTRNRRRHRVRTAIVLVVVLALFGGALWGAYLVVMPVVRQAMAPTDYQGPGEGTVQVSIHDGATGRQIAHALVQARVIRTEGAFVKVLDSDARAANLQPGTFTLARHMSAADAFRRLLDPSARVASKVVVVEGARASEIFARVEQDTGISAASLAEAATAGDIGLPPGAPGIEGYLFPATYQFDPGTPPRTVLSTMVRRTTAELQAAGVPEDRWNDVLTRASLVQAEASDTDDFPKVARVIENRLAAGMKLQFDSTVHYALGSRGDQTVTTRDTQTDSPYNTYQHAGLPPAPVGQPGAQALQAVLHPADGHWLYFVTVNDDTGQTLFADTYAEHQRNVAQRTAWLAAQPKKP